MKHSVSRWSRVLAVGMGAFFFAAGLHAQAPTEVPTLAGTVLDPAGKSIPNATVTIKNEAGATVQWRRRHSRPYSVPRQYAGSLDGPGLFVGFLSRIAVFGWHLRDAGGRIPSPSFQRFFHEQGGKSSFIGVGLSPLRDAKPGRTGPVRAVNAPAS
jgi:hypothetical protein